MKKEQRIKKNEEFSAVFNRGSSMANRQFVLYILPKEGQDSLRLGLSVSKRVGNAVCRNRIKRYVREVFTQIQGDLKQHYDYVVIAHNPVKDMTYHEIKSSLEHVLRKSKMIVRVQQNKENRQLGGRKESETN
ncbi:ribonuclease P protein component [Shouchella lehensis]|uniref:Ribonuclease P protein component n=1 Tax=Shouchella lehensis TaxID=300825 RepID=A0A4Y7WG19_9BACI|nr:ribonuclease P protein component [Shouchella lehensis]MBG9785366.1 ribonuclease P [Shouchella lehensis]TES46811.1 ribonuclease P protein component [Shouchella lehensis]